MRSIRVYLVMLCLGLLVAMQPGCGAKPKKKKSAKDNFQAAAKIATCGGNAAGSAACGQPLRGGSVNAER